MRSSSLFELAVAALLGCSSPAAQAAVERGVVAARPPGSFELNAKTRLAEINQRIKALEARVKTADVENETDFGNAVKRVSDQSSSVEDLIGQLQRARPSDSMKTRITTALNDLERQVDHVEKNFHR